ncbi:uncharacterized protein LOC119661885 [Teleopsis dalmanni]|uniref:uncharacterized protein LOC119661885 n=1 Tax=Teleopsis dalmanni TaxID=139649 RepID=UPI0018CCDFE2|nr:uncharacterized protein LOC119661885 [Teleopsis dalmanni]
MEQDPKDFGVGDKPIDMSVVYGFVPKFEDFSKCINQSKEMVFKFFQLLDTDRDKIKYLCDDNATLTYIHEEYRGIADMMGFYAKFPNSEHNVEHIKSEKIKNVVTKKHIGFNIEARGTVTYNGNQSSNLKWFEQRFLLLEIGGYLKIFETSFKYV